MKDTKGVISVGVLACLGLAGVCPAGSDVMELYRAKKNLPTTKTNQPSAIETDGGQRVLHFPKDRSLGTLKIQDSGLKRQIKTFHYWIDGANWYEHAEYLGAAKGDVIIPAGKRVALFISPSAWKDLSPLTRLKKDDLYFLCIKGSYSGGPRPGDACMNHIAHLTGLKQLEILYTNITTKGIRQIDKMKSLESLTIANKLDDAGLEVISKLPSLKNLYIRNQCRITNKGMRYFGRLSLLEELAFNCNIVDDESLVHLSKLPRLRYLLLLGNKFTDEGMIHLKNIPNLKTLQLYWLNQLTDKALLHIAECDRLEAVSFHHNENITDKGLEYLSTIKSLKRLDIHKAQVTDEGLKHLSHIKTLDHLELPYRYINDQGLVYLSNLGNLRYLSVSLDENDKGFYTDESVKALLKLPLLEELTLGGRGMTDKSMEYISKMSRLKSFSLGESTSITDKGIAKLNKLTSLEHLRITFADITISGLSSLNNLSNLKRLYIKGLIQNDSVLDISGMTKLEYLTLITEYNKEADINDKDLACLANLKNLKEIAFKGVIGAKGLTYLEGLTKLEELGIGGSDFTDEGLKRLRNMKNMKRLSILCNDKSESDLEKGVTKVEGLGLDNTLTDEGLKYLAHMTNMEKLSIYGGMFTDEGLRHLEGMTKLRTLRIGANNNFSPQAMQRLQEQMPILETLEIRGMDER